MPNYVTHAIMADKTIISSPIELDHTITRSYSIGQDLMFSCRNGLDTTHRKYTKAFFLNLISYIKENHLTENSQIMSYLYGHILHYNLDKTAHPFIYYMTNDVDQKGLVSFHMACEEYIGYYLLQKELGLTIKNITNQFYTNFQWTKSKELPQLIDHIYYKTYGYQNAFKAQQKTGILLKLLDASTRMMQGDNGKNYLKFIKFYDYLAEAHLTEKQLTNEGHDFWYNPITEECSDLSLLDLVNQSITFSLEMIEAVQKVIYDGVPVTTLDSVFDNSSYDTGLDCSIGTPFTYSRVKKFRLK